MSTQVLSKTEQSSSESIFLGCKGESQKHWLKEVSQLSLQCGILKGGAGEH